MFSTLLSRDEVDDNDVYAQRLPEKLLCRSCWKVVREFAGTFLQSYKVIIERSSRDYTMGPSRDTSDDSHIRRLSSESANGDFEAPSSSHHKRQQGLVERNGHLDPTQRLIYLCLLGFSVLSALTGLALLLVWVNKYSTVKGIGIDGPGKLANLHPIMMYIFMVSLNMYAVLVYRTHYSSPKQRLKWTHAVISGVNIVMSVLGVLAMVRAHDISGLANFYTLHSWIGVTTNIFYMLQFVSGFVAFLRPGMAQHRRAALMPWHRLAGALILVLAALSAITGITELVIFKDKDNYATFAPITFIANFAGLSVVLMTSISIYLLTANKWRRPNLPEEEPLKR